MKVITILGTRPEIIKLSPLIPLLDLEFNHILVHTGQHYSKEMDQRFFEELELRQPNYNLNIGSGTHGEQTGKMVAELEKIFLHEKPTHVIIFGDTNSTLAGALAAVKIHLQVIHIEAGARSHNKQQPEEINRLLADHCSDLLFTIDTESTENLLREGFKREQIFQVGNLVEESCARILATGAHCSVLQNMGVAEGKFIVATIHRAENTDNLDNLRSIVAAFNILSKKITLFFPIHPRTKKVITESNIQISPEIRLLEPTGYASFIELMSKARFVITDSGGVFEEAVFLNVPVIITREMIELRESVEKGKSFLVGASTEKIVALCEKLISDEKEIQRIKNIPMTFPQNISQRIVEVLKNRA